MAIALVSGANGFIGSHLVRELLRRGYEVRGLVRDTSDLTSLHGLPVTLFIGDVRQPETLAAPMQGVDYVFHLAARLMVTSQEAFVETNTQGTIHMLETARKYAGRGLKRFLYVSSQAAAGPGQDATPFDETVELKPISWYGTSKKQAEEAVRSYADSFPVTIVRPAAVYGEREKDISQTYPLVERGLQPKLGLQPKYAVMVYVGDLVRGMVDAAESDKAVNQVYFLNHPQVLSAEAITRTIAQAMAKPRGVMFPIPLALIRLAAPFGEMVYNLTGARPPMTRDKAREVSERFWIANPGKAKRDFGWEAHCDLLSGMQGTTRYFLQQEQGAREMAADRGLALWAKYLLCAVLLGTLIEISSALGHFYTFQPGWLVLVVVFGAFGLSLGTLALFLRKQADLLQFAAGTLVAGVVEYLNAVEVIRGWTFAPGWPLGLTDPLLRSVVLGCAGGLFILIVNFLVQSLYRQRLHAGV